MRRLGYFAVSIVLTLALILGVRTFANMVFNAKPPARAAIEVPPMRGAQKEEKKAEAPKKEAAATGEQKTAEAQPAAAASGPDPKHGKKVFAKCKACHFADKEKHKVGPHLVGVVGRPVASAEGFKYSDAMKAKAAELGAWTEENLMKYLENPKGVVPGTKMSFAGLKKEQDRRDVIAYLKSLAGK